MTDAKPFRPSEGGSFLVGKDGKVTRTGGTFAPNDPRHEANAPPAPASPVPETRPAKGGRK
jgi:hypothetical protein